MSSMEFVSTRDPGHRTSFSGALQRGLAPDGGLYLPANSPRVTPTVQSLSETAATIIAPFAEGDALAPMISALCESALNFPAPYVPLSADGTFGVLELFHGPTAAFKDVGARFLAACLAQLPDPHGRVTDILVATSGDTGGAVAAACEGHDGLRVTLLFPKGRVSPTQQQQLTCWGSNVRSCAVRGSFDDCQRMVKEAFQSPQLRERYALASANSINIGRLLPQAAYYATTSAVHNARRGTDLSFVIPSGNLGNAFACVIARRLGYPIGRILLAHNANTTVPDFLATGEWNPRPSVTTLASAMDVGNPSNMERFRAIYPDIDTLRAEVSAASVNDADIRQRIRSDANRFAHVWCPHTAVGAEVHARLPGVTRDLSWCLVATAHPAKFPEVVERALGRSIVVPASLAKLSSRATHVTEIDASLAALEQVLAR